MATITFHPLLSAPTLRSSREPAIGVMRRFFARLAAGRRRRAERAIAGYIERRGGKFTDGMERDIERRLMFDGWTTPSFSDRG
jgi:hypothetical protein